VKEYIMHSNAQEIAKYVSEHVRLSTRSKRSTPRKQTIDRLEKAFSLLPDETLDLFLNDRRKLTVQLEPNLKIPFGMGTNTRSDANQNTYTIIIREEHEDWSEDLFLGSFLRELGHVVCERPPDDEWPTGRGDRARFRERIEYLADAMVWKWGLRHYSMRHLYATYPEHWVEKIVAEIEKVLVEDERFH
jgi:hypothetical protein